MDNSARQSLLDDIAAQVRDCSNCRLCEGRNLAVSGEGPADAPVMFIGEAPGAAEDRQGRPFVGPAGQLLNQLLLGAGLRRPEVFITNIVKCRPPQNREPRPEEITACREYLDGQIAILQPPLICLLGRPATQTLLDPTLAMGRAHGRLFEREGLSFMPIYHPAAALHNPNMRAPLEQDFAALATFLQDRKLTP
ncbi:MAG: uracil-DNA glycosylase [candidate division WS1 bacterium]|jgi:DNA polymerase|nr:uracil-DNA glycosylase [candidate division WS1 bacterium]